MLRLPAAQPAEITIELPAGATLTATRPTAVTVEAARAHAQRLARQVRDGLDPLGLLGAAPGDGLDLEDPEQATAIGQVLFVICLAQRCARRWDGIGDQDGQPIACTPDHIARLVRDVPWAADRIVQGLTRHLLEGAAEGNA